MRENLFKKGIMKKVIGMVLALVMVVTLMPLSNMTVYADSTISSITFTSYPTKYRSNSGANIIVKDDGTAATVADIIVPDDAHYSIVETAVYSSTSGSKFGAALVRPSDGYAFSDASTTADSSKYWLNGDRYLKTSSDVSYVKTYVLGSESTAQVGDACVIWSLSNFVSVTSVTLNKTSVTLTEDGATETLTATILPNNATIKTVNWSSSDASVATVNDGVVTPLAAGNTTITATANDGSGKSATCEVTVSPSTPTVSSIAMKSNPTKITYAIGDSLDLTGAKITATMSDSTTKDIVITSSMVTGFDSTTEGTKTITVTYEGKTTTFTVTVKKAEDGDVKVPEEKQEGNFAAGGLASPVDDVKKAVLTDEDKAAIEAGKDINIWVEVKDQSSTVPAADKNLVEQKLPDNYSVGIYLDINLWKQITGSDATKVTELPNGKVKISITIPESLRKSGRTFKIIRVHNGVATAIDVTVDENNVLTFETDQFSTYALTYKDKEEGKSPKTGDTNSAYMWVLLMMAGIALVGVSFCYRKRKVK